MMRKSAPQAHWIVRPATAGHLLALLLLAAVGLDACHAATRTLFSQDVGLLVNARIDPLISPGTCSGHVHSVFGNKHFGAEIAPQSLQDTDWRNEEGKYDLTTSELTPNMSMYWAPALYILHEGVYHLVPSFARPYYRISVRGDWYRKRINPFPRYLRMIVGNAMRMTAWDPKNTNRDNIRWTLRTLNRRNTNYRRHGDWTYLRDNPLLAQANQVEMNLNFPECLAVNGDGTPKTSSANYRSHMRYSTGWSWKRKSFCPASHPYQIPRLNLEVRYELDPIRAKLGLDVVNDVRNWRLATGDASGAGGHADFVNGWPPELMRNLIRSCKNQVSTTKSIAN